MNGQMYQICFIAAATKKVLNTKKIISYVPLKYENRVDFQFLSRSKLFFQKTVESIEEWYVHCLEKGLQDIKLIAPIAVDDRMLLGFSNETQSSLVCFWEGKVTYFTAKWEFDSAKKMWNVLYIEQKWENAPSGKPHFENNAESFKAILIKIRELAYKLDSAYFAEVFQRAFDILSGIADCKEAVYDMPILDILKENLCLFQAASIADVFGAMGSWNDSPPCIAHEKGLSEEYDSLSGELLKQIRLALLYAINEW